MKAIDKELLHRFFQRGGEFLSGDWILLGGAVLTFLQVSSRQTYDVDLVGPKNNTDTLALMNLADDLGLPIETVNQGAAFFLHKIVDWQKDIIEIHKGSSATFYRPNTHLFLKLKMARLSEADLEDCRVITNYAKSNGENINIEMLRNYADTAIKTQSELHRMNLEALFKDILMGL